MIDTNEDAKKEKELIFKIQNSNNLNEEEKKLLLEVLSISGIREFNKTLLEFYNDHKNM